MAEAKSRTYRSTLREEQAEQTRLRIARAAHEKFIELGWNGTNIRAVAAAAGVSEATVFAVYGSKAGLALSLIDSTDAIADTTRLIAELAANEGNPRGQLAASIAFDRRLYQQGGSLLRMVWEGRRTESALAEAYAAGRARGEAGRRELFESWPSGTLRSGMTVDRAVDIYAITISIDTYDIATHERGWDADEIEAWWIQSLSGAILAS